MNGPGWTASDELGQLSGAWVTALGALAEVTRDASATVETRTGSSYAYTFATLAAVLGAARPVLAAHGLGLFQTATIDDGDVVVNTCVMHTSGEWLAPPPFRLPAGNTAQSAGSSVSFARRYAVLALLGIATDDDDGATAGTRTAPVPDRAVVDTFNALTTLSPASQAELRRLANEHDRKLSQAALAADPAWLGVVRAVIDRDRNPSQAVTGSVPVQSATRAQLAALDTLERRIDLGLARSDVVRAVVGRDITDDTPPLTAAEAAALTAAYRGLDDGTSALRYESDGAVTITARTDIPAAIPSETESGPS